MKYLKGTKTECEAYDAAVSEGEGYPNARGTLRWVEPVERDGDYYIRKHADYAVMGSLEEVNTIPKIQNVEE